MFSQYKSLRFVEAYDFIVKETFCIHLGFYLDLNVGNQTNQREFVFKNCLKKN